jgi:hypothetical protein
LPNAAIDPVSAAAGDIYYNSVSNTIRLFNGTSWMDISGGTSGGNLYYVNGFTLSPTDISNGFVTLASAPDVPADTILTVIGGPMQAYGPDFTVSGNQLRWSGLFLAGVLVSGDILVIQYN